MFFMAGAYSDAEECAENCCESIRRLVDLKKVIVELPEPHDEDRERAYAEAERLSSTAQTEERWLAAAKKYEMAGDLKDAPRRVEVCRRKVKEAAEKYDGPGLAGRGKEGGTVANDDFRKKTHWRCNKCGTHSPFEVTICTNANCRADLLIYGEAIVPEDSGLCEAYQRGTELSRSASTAEEWLAAAAAFDEAGDYSDAISRAAECRELARTLRETDELRRFYECATELERKAITREDWQSAEAIFIMAGAYSDAEERAENCRKNIRRLEDSKKVVVEPPEPHDEDRERRERAYIEAVRLASIAQTEESWLAAARKYEESGDFKDAPERAEACRRKAKEAAEKRDDTENNSNEKKRRGPSRHALWAAGSLVIALLLLVWFATQGQIGSGPSVRYSTPAPTSSPTDKPSPTATPEPTASPTPKPTAAPKPWAGNVMAAVSISEINGEIVESDEICVIGSDIKASRVASVTFLDTLDDMGNDAWDASEAGDESVMAWTEMEMEIDLRDGESYYNLFIGGEGGVTAPDNCFAMFGGYTNLKSINFNGALHMEGVKFTNGMFYHCSSLESIDLSFFDTSSVSNMEYMFDLCQSLEELDLSSFDTSNVQQMDFMFYGCSSLKELDLSGFDTSSATTMRSMFNRCKSLRELDLSSFDTSSVTDMRSMFFECTLLERLDVTSFDTSNVTDMYAMFYACPSLSSLNVGYFDTSSVTTMKSMFSRCSSLVLLDTEYFDGSSVTDTSYMFYGCTSLDFLNLSSFYTPNVTDMSYMFSNCTSLEVLAIENLDTGNVTDMSYMFYAVPGDCAIFMPDKFDVSSVTDHEYFCSEDQADLYAIFG